MIDRQSKQSVWIETDVGPIQISPEQASDPFGDECQLSATHAEGWRFADWRGDVTA